MEKLKSFKDAKANKKILLTLFTLLVLTVGGADMMAQEEPPEYPYRPTCADPETIENKVWAITDWWLDGTEFDYGDYKGTHGDFELCYINESVLYIQYDWGIETNSGKLWREGEDIYSTNIGGQSNAIKAERGFITSFEYYFPSDNGVCYTQEPSLGRFPLYAFQSVIFNNVEYTDANCGGCEDFLDARYDILDPAQLTCDEWHTFYIHSENFESDFGVEEGVNRLVSFNVQFANAYIRNVEFIYGNKLDKVYELY